MSKEYVIRLTKQQAELCLYELSQGVIGDNAPYDNKLKRLIKKIKEQINEQEKRK